MSKDSIAKQIANAAYDIAFKNGFSNAQLMRIKNSVESIIAPIEQERAGAEDAEKLGDAIKDYVKKYGKLTITVGEYDITRDYDSFTKIAIDGDKPWTVESGTGHISFGADYGYEEDDEDW